MKNPFGQLASDFHTVITTSVWMIAITISSALLATSYHFPYDHLIFTINEIELKSISSIVIVKIAAIAEEWFPHDCNERFVCIGACIAGE